MCEEKGERMHVVVHTEELSGKRQKNQVPENGDKTEI